MRDGLSLVETVIALLILTFVSTAILLLTIQILSLTNLAKQKNKATTYAEQILEQVRDYEVTSGFGSLKMGCYTDVVTNNWGQTPFATCLPDCSNANLFISPENKFYRYVTVTPSGTGVKVSAVVAWKDKNTCKNTIIDTYYYNTQ